MSKWPVLEEKEKSNKAIKEAAYQSNKQEEFRI